MKNSEFISDLEIHDTKNVKTQKINGSLTVIWRDWDKIIKNQPKMVYVSSVNPYEIKGPHLHTKRTSYFTCIHGEVIFVIKNPDGKYMEIKSNAKKPILIKIPKMYASGHINLSNSVSRILTIADVSWKPNDNEMINVEFDDYDWTKWKK